MSNRADKEKSTPADGTEIAPTDSHSSDKTETDNSASDSADAEQEQERRMRYRESVDENLRQQRQQVQALLSQLNDKIAIVRESQLEQMDRDDEKFTWTKQIEHLEATNEELKRRVEEEVKGKQEALRQRIALKYELFEWRNRCEELKTSNRNWESRMAHTSRLEALNEKLKERIEEEISATEEERSEKMACKYEIVGLKRRCAELENAIEEEKENAENQTAVLQNENVELKKRCAELEAQADKWKEEKKATIRGSSDAMRKSKSTRFIDGEATKAFSEENVLLREQVRELTAKVTTQKKRTQEYKELWTRWQRECQTAETALREWLELRNLEPLQQFMREKKIASNGILQEPPKELGNTDDVTEKIADPSHSDPVTNYDDHNQSTRPPVFVGQTKTPAKVVIGIDFGTAYSGISILYADVPENVQISAPGAQASAAKVPTVLLRGPNDTWAFGHDALDRYATAMEDFEDADGESAENAGISLFRDYRTELDGETEGMDTLTGTSETGEDHSLMDLFARTLAMLSAHAMAEVKRSWGDMLKVQGEGKNIQWVLSVPASWNDFERDFVRMAACKAELISEETSDCLHFVSEPEAASLCINMDAPDLKILQKGSSFMIVDCGGETVDISCLQIRTQEPLVLDAMSPSWSVPFGGKHVDGAFRSFLGEFFGEDNMEIFYQESQAAVETVVEQFQKAKESFDLLAKDSWYVVSMSELVEKHDSVDLSSLVEAFNAKMSRRPKRVFSVSTNKVKKNLERGKLTFSHCQMLTIFFKPSFDGITSAIREEIAKCSQPVASIVVVGGYGASKALLSSIEKTFPHQNVVTTEVPQAAVTKGAALFGLYAERITPSIGPETQAEENANSEDITKEIEQLRDDLANLHKENTNLETARQQDNSKVAHLEKALQESKRETGLLQNQIKSMQTQTEAGGTDTKETNRQTLSLLRAATVKRSDSPGNSSSPSFPTGREISSLAVKLQYGVSDFLHSLHDALLEWEDYSGAKDTISSYRAVLDKIIMQCWDFALMYVAEFEHAKLSALTTFLGTPCTTTEMRIRVETGNSFLKVLWNHSMQEAVKHLASKKGQLLEGKTHAMRGGKLMKWARLPETTSAMEELDVPSWESFTEDLILLLLFCKFSDPSCYLWPNLGDETTFAPNIHKVEAFPGLSGRKKPKAGEMVRVLLPGLYFEDPRLNSSADPKTKAVIIALPRM